MPMSNSQIESVQPSAPIEQTVTQNPTREYFYVPSHLQIRFIHQFNGQTYTVKEGRCGTWFIVDNMGRWMNECTAISKNNPPLFESIEAEFQKRFDERTAKFESKKFKILQDFHKVMSSRLPKGFLFEPVYNLTRGQLLGTDPRQRTKIYSGFHLNGKWIPVEMYIRIRLDNFFTENPTYSYQDTKRKLKPWHICTTDDWWKFDENKFSRNYKTLEEAVDAIVKHIQKCLPHCKEHYRTHMAVVKCRYNWLKQYAQDIGLTLDNDREQRFYRGTCFLELRGSFQCPSVGGDITASVRLRMSAFGPDHDIVVDYLRIEPEDRKQTTFSPKVLKEIMRKLQRPTSKMQKRTCPNCGRILSNTKKHDCPRKTT